MFDELLPLIRRPFELTDLYQLDTNIFDGVNYACTQRFDMLDELEGLIRVYSNVICLTHQAKFVDTNNGGIFEALGANKEQKQCLFAPLATTRKLGNSLASCARVAICKIS